ncbi:MAG: sulfotransferase [Calditrichia bacterium]
MSKPKCITILSYKSCGSSALQYLLAGFPGVHHIANTRHHFNETLYWTKAASVLELPLKKMIDTEVPFSTEEARSGLITLLDENLDDFNPNAITADRELIFDGWQRLVESHGPVFVEKSPHHLYQWAAVELILQSMENLPEIDFLLIGLVRNPMDVLYSAFRRWGTPPEQGQFEWLQAYQNLLRLKEIVGDKLFILRYEDLISNINYLKPVFDFMGVHTHFADEWYFHTQSLRKWRYDESFYFRLSPEVFTLALKYGYKEEDLVKNESGEVL